jgi:hypothetical protein
MRKPERWSATVRDAHGCAVAPRTEPNLLKAETLKRTAAWGFYFSIRGASIRPAR